MESRNLEITLQSAKDLASVNLFTKMDVYAVVSISGGDKNAKQKTKSPVDHDGDANPTWNFTMKFTVDEAALQMNRLTLDFKLVCERALGDKDVGEVCVPIKELIDSPVKAGGDGKQFVSYQIRKPSGKPKGQLAFSYKFSDKIVGGSVASPYAAATPMAAPSSGKTDGEPVTAYPAGSSSVYPPPGAYPPTAAYPAMEGSGHYPPPPQAAYPAVEGSGHYPPPYPGAEGSKPYPAAPYSGAEGNKPYPAAPYSGAEGSKPYPAPPYSGAEGSKPYDPPATGYPPAPNHGGYGYPPPAGYGYPPPPPAGYGYPPQQDYGYPPQQGYGYPPPPVVQPPKKNKKFGGMGMGLGLGAGLLGGLLVGDMISDVGDFDGGGFDF